MNITVGQVFRCAATAVLLSALTSLAAPAQRFNISTNLMEYANLGTLNLDVSYGVARNWSVGAGVRCNPFKFESERRGVFFNRQQSYSVGARYWLWHINTGWWFGSKLRFQEYSSGGVFSDGSEEGNRYGVGMYAGYSYMIFPHFNIEFGLGMWGGGGSYRSYSCPVCGITVGEGNKMFILPDDVMIALVYVF